MTEPWTVAPAVIALQRTLDDARPGRRTGHPDGTIGDADHSARDSDHNPDADREVCAVDVHDSAQLDDGELYDAIKAGGAHNPVKYAINNGRIWSPQRGEHRYTGPNAHADHCHVSVTQAGKHRTDPWHLPGITEELDMALTDQDVDRIVDAVAARIAGPRRADRKDDDPRTIETGDVLTAIDRLAARVDELSKKLDQ